MATEPRLLDPQELAIVAKLSRETRQWSQEQLAELSGLSVRTIQRVERGQPADLHTRRALARAFRFDDIDAFNKPFAIPTQEEQKAEREKFDREHVILAALPLVSGRQLAKLAEEHEADVCKPGVDLERRADEEFAALVDELREYRDCAELYSEVQKFEIYDSFQQRLERLKSMGVSLCHATRPMQWPAIGSTQEPLSLRALYLVAFPLGEEPKQFATPRSVAIG